jgi:hypothetical protein
MPLMMPGCMIAISGDSEAHIENQAQVNHGRCSKFAASGNSGRPLANEYIIDS